MKIKKTFLFLVALLGGMYLSSAQSLLEKLEAESSKDPLFTLATFKSTRISIGHSVETRKKNVFEISVMNRFWNLPKETSNAFVADKMSSRFGLDYGISDRLTYGVGFSTLNSILDNFLKYRLIRQHDNGPNKFSITLFQSITYADKKTYGAASGVDFSDKLAFTTQLLFARKFTRNFSLQVSPTFIKRNRVASPLDDKNQFALGFGGRYKLGNHVSIVSEYYYVTNPLTSSKTYGAFSLGTNWELSDLLLQFKLTNSGHFVEDAFITQTKRNFSFRDGHLFFGFHATFFLQL